MFFHALTFAGSRGRCLNLRPLRWMFKLLPRDLANVNALKQTCLIIILAFYMISWKIPSKTYEKVALTALYTSVGAILFFALTSFSEKCNDVDINKNQDKMPIAGQPSIVVWRHVTIYLPSWRFLSKTYVKTACESHDSNMVLVVCKGLLVDLTMA